MHCTLNSVHDTQGSEAGLRQWQLNIIMEYCSGGTLLDAIVRDRLTAVASMLGKNKMCFILDILIQVG